MYSPQLLQHLRNPLNVGELPPPAITVEVSNPACGDVLRISAEFQEEQVIRAAYRTRGCAASIAAGSALTVLMNGRSVDNLQHLTETDVEQVLGGLPPASRHAAVLCRDAIQALVTELLKSYPRGGSSYEQ